MTIKKIEEFDERKRAEEILKNGFGQKIEKKDIAILAKVFYEEGLSDKKVKDKIINLCKEKHYGFNEIIYRESILKAIKIAKKYPLKPRKDVLITKKELDIIRCFSQSYAKVLFVMLVYAKYDGIRIDKKGKESFYCNMQINHILGCAKVQMGHFQIWKKMMYEFKTKDLIRLSQGTENSFRVNFVDSNGDAEIIVTDMNNIIGYFPCFCENCKKVIKDAGKRQKYCDECRTKINKEKTKNRVNKHRNKCNDSKSLC